MGMPVIERATLRPPEQEVARLYSQLLENSMLVLA